MKQYPSIPRKLYPDVHLYGFDKLDGSNIRAEWDRKNGFTRFGSRRRLLDDGHPELASAPDLIRERFAEQLGRIFTDAGFRQTLAFFEFFGADSFAGFHVDSDPKAVVLIDVMIHKRGLMEPQEFVRLFDAVPTPKLLHEGPITNEIVERIEAGNFPGMTFEGVVFKGRGGKKGGKAIMFKVKNRAWLDRLKLHCADDETLFAQLM